VALLRRTSTESSTTALAAADGLRQALRFFARERAWINAQHLELCRIPAPTFFEQKRAAWMLEQFRTMGADAKIDRAGNVICFPYGDQGDGDLIAVTAHLDTVLAPRQNDDIRIGPDGKFYGPGVADNGAGLAALLAIARALRDEPIDHLGAARIVLCANVGEEGEGNLSGMRYLCRQSSLAPRLGTFIVLDGPGTAHITSKALGSRRYEIVLTGPGGHSWADFGVANPIHALSQVIAAFAGLFTAGEPKASFNFGIIEGGASINSIPTEARAKLDLRSESTHRLDELAELLTDCVERALEIENGRIPPFPGKPPRVTAKLREIGFRPGGALPSESALLEALQQVDRYLGIRSLPDCASTDANIPLSLGLPAVSIGAGGQGGGAHTPSEWYHPENRDLALRRILLTLAHLLR
jgi:tripeptide aminopeptidase